MQRFSGDCGCEVKFKGADLGTGIDRYGQGWKFYLGEVAPPPMMRRLLPELSRLAVEPHFPRRAGFGKRDEVAIFGHARKLHSVAPDPRRHVLVVELVHAEILPVAQDQ